MVIRRIIVGTIIVVVVCRCIVVVGSWMLVGLVSGLTTWLVRINVSIVI